MKIYLPLPQGIGHNSARDCTYWKIGSIKIVIIIMIIHDDDSVDVENFLTFYSIIELTVQWERFEE